MTAKNIPFDFILDYLLPLDITVKPMFGMFAIYSGPKIMLMLRQRSQSPEMNGIWLATTSQHHISLKQDLPSLSSISTKARVSSESEWQLLPSYSDDFEACAIRICELIVRGDVRIGRLSKAEKTK